MPRAPCSSDATAAAVDTAELPPPPAPTSPGEAGVGAAFSQGEVPFALPGITRTAVGSIGALVTLDDACRVDGVVAGRAALRADEPPELQAAIAHANAPTNPTTFTARNLVLIAEAS